MPIEQGQDNYEQLIEGLLGSLGISKSSFQEAIAWSLCEHMVTFLSGDRDQLMNIKNDPDFLAKFAVYLREKTGRKWSFEDAEVLSRRLFMFFEEKHSRKPIRYDDWLRLLFTTPLRCDKCGAGPPRVKLEIDHVFPSSRGGTSTVPNLRYLCQKHNRQKSARLEVAKPWLTLG